MQEYGNRRISSANDIVAQGFMTKVYMWMALGLAATAATAYYVSTSAQLIYMLFGRGMMPIIVLSLAELGIVFFLSAKVAAMNPTTASALFFVFAILNGLTLSSIFLVYTSESISSAFFSAAGMFGAMSVYGTVTKRDLTGLGGFCRMGLIGIVIASLINIFVASEKTSLVIAIMGVFVFIGLTAFDTQKLRRLSASVGDDDTAAKYSVLGALTLYLDFINMFLFLLRIFGRRR
ncbi:MAG: Bax inhibitor-1/YccA family protein [Synergistaceae bacterium]|jgi:FtsH-binding integral membrane protein|nr:Bax inhibitor-1/YccA family protein [Synergistaceae bacterium]